ncbi:uncharacterized protein B0T23DRAFT_384578 [Neurospora hispaniola]|uniref:Secreted protein n=1 Tax=Neurospora hispaniola TaxID=588809 RepID=A0AAJ0I3V8_9PEZI|nr:hypothetical protein B0T23DRAFT_384578 [Neurospora hispaniola]
MLWLVWVLSTVFRHNTYARWGDEHPLVLSTTNYLLGGKVHTTAKNEESLSQYLVRVRSPLSAYRRPESGVHSSF